MIKLSRQLLIVMLLYLILILLSLHKYNSHLFNIFIRIQGYTRIRYDEIADSAAKNSLFILLEITINHPPPPQDIKNYRNFCLHIGLTRQIAQAEIPNISNSQITTRKNRAVCLFHDHFISRLSFRRLPLRQDHTFLLHSTY